MNQKEKKSFIKRELAALENEEQLFQQCLSSITSRKRYLESELDSLGASNSTRKGKYDNILSEDMKLKLQASLTK
jgi:uncharacterized protein (DUF3084 family)